MTDVVTLPDDHAASLPALVDRAAAALAGARTAAEILEAREQAGVAYDVAKRAARFAKAKGAHEDITKAIDKVKADALEIESKAKIRLADEFDAAQERGEIASAGRPHIIPDGNNIAFVKDLGGLTSKQIYEARQLRDAEAANPGIIHRHLQEQLEAGEEPTREEMRAAVIAAAKRGLRSPSRPSNRNPLYNPNPQFTAMVAVCDGCAMIMDKVRGLTPEYIIGGFVDDGMRERNLADVIECHNFLTDLLEAADA